MPSSKKSKASDAESCSNCSETGCVLQKCSRCKLTQYCDKDCQRAHWIASHKVFCIIPTERTPAEIKKAAEVKVGEKPSSTTKTGISAKVEDVGDECAICLYPLRSEPTSKLPCSHEFHVKCVKEVRLFCTVKLCPLCRSDLPAAEKDAFAGNVKALCAMANLMRRRGDLKGAEATFIRAIETDSSYADAHLCYGMLLKVNGDLVGAEREYLAAIKYEPTNTMALSNLGWVLMMKGSMKAAVTVIRRAIHSDPFDENALQNLGYALSHLGDKAGAEEAFRNAIKYARSNRLMAVASGDLGSLLVEKGNFEGAKAAFRKVIELEPKNTSAQNMLASVLWETGDLNGAEKHYRLAVKLEPGNAGMLSDFGDFLIDAREDFVQAEKMLSKAHELDPTSSMVLNNYASILRRKGDLRGAESKFRHAIKADSRNWLPYVNLGVVLLQQNNLVEVEATCLKAIDIFQSDCDVHKSSRDRARIGSAHGCIGIIMRKRFDNTAALKELNQAVALNPNDSVALINRGEVLAENGEFDAALSDYYASLSEGMSAGSGQNYAHYFIGQALFAKGDLCAAESSYRRYARIEPNDPGAYSALGATLQAKGNLKEAANAYKEALRLNPFDFRVASLLRAVESLSGRK